MHSPAGIECEACHTDDHGTTRTRQSNSRRSASFPAPTTRPARNATLRTTKRRRTACTRRRLQPATWMRLICTDCHGAHDVRPPDEPRSHDFETCSQCHTEIR
ncbi:MAG: hypothetical protein MZV49_25415 [Rhodopseudomonas palustris]|nr:hypothetical protein [Rhodopseudomonas palustris]